MALQRQRSGEWNSATGTCELKIEFARSDKRYQTLSLDIIATQAVNGSPVRQRVKGSIAATGPTVNCLQASAPRR